MKEKKEPQSRVLDWRDEIEAVVLPIDRKPTDVLQGERALANKVVKALRTGPVNVRPLLDWMIVRRIENAQTGLIIIANPEKELSDKGEIVAIGPGRSDEGMTMKLGERVMFPKHLSIPIEIDGEELLLMRESGVLCTYEGDDVVKVGKKLVE